MVIAEGMASGIAVIISAAGGAAELLALGDGALGFPPGHAAALSDRIAQLALDPELRRELGLKARRTAEAYFDRDRLAGELMRIYKAGLQHHSDPVDVDPYLREPEAWDA